MHAKAPKRIARTLTAFFTAAILAACGQGDGPERIANEPATPLPPLPEGFCDPINFEIFCELPAINNFNGGATTVIDNPDQGGLNDTDKVAQMQKFPDDPALLFGGTNLQRADNIDFSEGESFTMLVWSPRSVRVTFKLEEQGNPGGGREVELTHTGSSSWELLCYDFTGQTGGIPTPVNAVTVIFDNGVRGGADTDPANWTFFYDEITQVADCGGAGGPGPLDLPQDFENAENSQFNNFDGGEIDIIPNPDMSGINLSNTVARMQKFDGAVFGGSTMPLANPIDFGNGEAFLVKVWASRQVPVLFKLEGLNQELEINHTGSGSWEEICYDFTGLTAGPASQGITFIFDLGTVGDAAGDPDNWTFYIDDVVQAADCAGGGPPPADPGTIPDVVIYATDPAVPVDLVFGVDYTGFEAFGSGSTFDNNVVTDADFNPSFGVTTGDGYGAQVGQFAIIGFAAGFATGYQTLDFKAKGLNNNLVRVKFLDAGDYIDIDLASSGYSTALGNGWYQVSVPIADFTGVDTATGLLFETDNTAAAAFQFLLTDFGFSGTSGAAPGTIPDVVIYATDPAVPVDLVFGVDYTGFEPFGSGSAFDNNVMTDADFNPSFGVTTGDGYGAQVGQFGIVGFAAGFATGYRTLDFKAKGLNNDLIRVKFLDAGDYIDITLTTSGYSTALGNDWYQVSVPIADFTGVDTATGLLFETDNTAAAAFQFLLTDFGFSGTAGGGGALVTNGDFEAGNLDDWETFDNGGTITLVSPGAGGGGSAVNLNVIAPGNPTLKQTGIGVGTLGPNEPFAISFDWRGSAANGGVIDFQVFSEQAGGGVTKADLVQGGDAFPADWTTVGPLNFTTAADVSGGLTVQITAICGGAAGCVSDLFIDNIVITTP